MSGIRSMSMVNPNSKAILDKLNLPPFKKGGRISGKKGKPKAIVAHGGEYILPVGVKPTKAQKAEVAKRHKKK
jgi:hypothetical protein